METKLEVKCMIHDTESVMPVSIDSQTIAFKYDKFTKGKNVAITLTSNNGGIDAPKHNIYLDNKDLKKILQFLIESEK